VSEIRQHRSGILLRRRYCFSIRSCTDFSAERRRYLWFCSDMLGFRWRRCF